MISYFKKKYAFDIIIIVLVLFLAAFMYAYLLFPDNTEFKTPFFSIKSNFRKSVQIMMYFLFSKLHLVLLLSLMLLTASSWWKYFLIPIILIGYYQIAGILGEEYSKTTSYFVAVFFLVNNLVFLFLLSKKLSMFQTNIYNILNLDILRELINLKHNEAKNKNIVQNLGSKKKSTIENSKNLRGELRDLQVMINDQNKSIPDKFFDHKASMRHNCFITLFLIAIPFMIFSFKHVPDEAESILFGLYEGAVAPTKIKFFVWFVGFKMSLLVLLTIWFVTTKQIWRYAILINIAVVAFQILEIFRDTKYLDEKEILYALPIIIPLLILIYFLARWVKYKSKTQIINEIISGRINQIIETLHQLNAEKNELIMELQELKSNQHTMPEQIYYEKLNKLKIAVQREMNLR
tara:strand:+ start:183483 stop:184697 length:1215 start_codon:yes stop_codon:yes gene_type:complete